MSTAPAARSGLTGSPSRVTPTATTVTNSRLAMIA